MDLALVVIFVGGIVAGVCSFLAATWHFHHRLYSLEDTVALLEGIVNREVKARAGMTRKVMKDPLEEQLEQVLAETPAANPPAVKVPFWQRFPRENKT